MFSRGAAATISGGGVRESDEEVKVGKSRGTGCATVGGEDGDGDRGAGSGSVMEVTAAAGSDILSMVGSAAIG